MRPFFWNVALPHVDGLAGEPCDDAANNAKLLYEMKNVPAAQRTAHYDCVLALADAERVLLTAAGRVDGRITDVPRGGNGFGYDPLFYVPEAGGTFGELAPDVKLRLSHRARAFAALQAQLQHWHEPEAQHERK